MGRIVKKITNILPFFGGIICISVLLLLYLLISSLSGCSGELGDAIDEDNEGEDPSLFTAEPSAESEITAHEHITLYFPISMNITGLSITGDFADSVFTWSTRDYPNDTLTISPSAGTQWTAGDNTLNFTAIEYQEPQSISYTVFNGMCVSITDGSDIEGDGRVLNPYESIQKGIQETQSVYTTGEVHVAEGEYESDYRNTGEPVIDMLNNISVYGGYKSDFSERIIETYETWVIDTSSTAGGDTSNPNRSVNCENTISTQTIISGLYIRIGKGTINTGVFCYGNNCEITIQNNYIYGRESSTDAGDESCGIIINSSASPNIISNYINPRYNDNNNVDIDKSYGIYNIACESNITSNTIFGGQGKNTVGIYSEGLCNPTINNNKIDAGSGDSLNCIELFRSSPIISNNEFNNQSGKAITFAIFNNDKLFFPIFYPSTISNNNFNFQGNWYRDCDGTSIVDYTNFYTQTVKIGSGTNTLDAWGNYSQYAE
jgi:hypothetical protein